MTRATDEQRKIGGWSMLADPMILEAMARAGMDFIGLDVQHGCFDFAAGVRGVQLLDCLGMPTLVRLSIHDLSAAPRYLDAGASGVIVAMVDGPADAARAVEAVRYQPTGHRSYGRLRYGLKTEPDDIADVRPEVYAMVETAGAVATIDQLAAVAGLAGLYVGPVDLGLALHLGHPVKQTEPRWRQTVDHVVAATRAHRRQAGMFSGGGAEARQWLDRGFDQVVLSSDIALLTAAVDEELARARPSSYFSRSRAVPTTESVSMP